MISAPGIRNSRKPRIQYENAAGPAGCTADACTMKSTTATKITTMSKDPRTRGSIPGAMRSDAMTRSLAAVVVAMPVPPHEECAGCPAADILGRPPAGSQTGVSADGHPRVSGPARTTSNAVPGTRLSSSSWASCQPGSGAPEMNQLEPLSATIIP